MKRRPVAQGNNRRPSVRALYRYGALWGRVWPLVLAVFLASGFLIKTIRWWTLQRDPGSGPVAAGPAGPLLLGYVDRMIYSPGDTVILFLSSVTDTCPAAFGRFGTAGSERIIAEFRLEGLSAQATGPDAVEKGAQWKSSSAFPLPGDLKSGYYFLRLGGGNGRESFKIPILVRDARRGLPLALFANVSTWTAYNEWGGASLYLKPPSGKLPHFVSFLRPNIAFSGPTPKHDIVVEAHVYNWLDSIYGCQLFADPELDRNDSAIATHRILVLPYHPEYFSPGMYATLRRLVFEKGKSLLYLGGNGIYHKVRWHQDLTMECRKDLTPFAGTRTPGGLWRWSLHPEQTLLGLRYSDAGYGSLAPYRVESGDHWLWNGTGIRNGKRFGEAGFDGKPISGPETDKAAWLSPPGAVRLARGLNPIRGAGRVFPDSGLEWDGAGGADLVYFEPTDTSGVLSAGSIRIGAGLGIDPALTGLVDNFLSRHAPPEARGADQGAPL